MNDKMHSYHEHFSPRFGQFFHFFERFYAGLPRFLSPPVSVFMSSFFTVSLALIGGNSKAFVLPPSRPFHNPIDLRFVHVNKPTHGCTFQCSVNVAFSRSAIFPVASVIWYLGFWSVNRTIPGCVPSGYGFPERLDLDFDFDFDDDDDDEDNLGMG